MLDLLLPIFVKLLPFNLELFDFGSIASSITGSETGIVSRIIGFFSSHQVSPVVVILSPTVQQYHSKYFSITFSLGMQLKNSTNSFFAIFVLF
jgi:hypothetical protein